MGFPSFLLSFFLVFHLLLSSGSSCPSSFVCGPLRAIKFPFTKFPFTNDTYPQCGLCQLRCDGVVPEVVLGEEVPSYQVSNITDYTIKISDRKLKDRIESKDCDIFSPIILPNTPSISFTISTNLTFFKCLTNSPLLQYLAEEHFSVYYSNPSNYTEYKGCQDHTVYYSYPNNTVPPKGSYPENCEPFQLPVVSSVKDPSLSDPFSLLTSEFSVEYLVSKECRDCLHDGGMCPRQNQKFHCLKGTGDTDETGGTNKAGDTNKTGERSRITGRKRLALILGTVIPGVILLPLFILIIRYRKKWRNYFSSYTIWRNTSSDHLSKGGLEEGSAYFGIPVFSYSELKEATHNFDPSKELGDGGFGTVYHGKLKDGREVAVKRLYQHNYKRVAQFLNEIEILTHLHHPNLVTLYGCTSRHSRELLLVYEYIPNGTVADHLHGDQAKDHPLPWPIRMNIAIETASALVYLHASEIIHRDVKTNNILLDNNFCVKVADFGLSRLFPTDASHVSTAPQGTPGYVDPDYHQCYQLTDKSDVYSFGVVLVELISSLPAVDISRHRHEINLANLAISRIQDGAFNELIDPALGFNSDSSVERMTTAVAEVAFRCLQLEKEMRPRMNEVLEALKEIQEYKDDEIGEMPPPSPDGANVELLNSSKVPPSQDSVTNGWFSSSTASISTV